MTEENGSVTPPQPGGYSDPHIVRRRHFPIVWVVPLIASLIGIAMLVHSWLAAGPRIYIEFTEARGLEAGKTHISYKDVVVGTVSGVSLSEDHSKVIAVVDMAQSVRDMLKADTRFWIVRPQIGASGISGIETLLSGVYITLDPGTSSEPQTHFSGLDEPPLVTSGLAGTSYVLTAADIGSLGGGSPIYFHHLRAGRIVSYKLGADGKTVAIRAFVDAPYDRFVTTDTRFWNASGVDVSISAAGMKVETQSLATIVAGGVAYDDPPGIGNAAPAAAQSVFTLGGTRSEAMADPDGPPTYFRMRFDQPLRGLLPGAPLEFFGVNIGEVTRVTVDFDPPTQKFSVLVDVVAYTRRLGSVLAKFPTANGDQEKVALFIGSLVHNGLRAQARTGNLLTGQLYIALDFMKSVPPAAYDATSRPLLIPTTPGTFDKLQGQVGAIVARLDRLPLDSIGKGLDHDIQQLGTTLQLLNTSTLPKASDALTDARGVLQGAGGALDSNSTLQLNLNDLMQELTRAARSLRVLSDTLAAHPESLIRGRRAQPAPAPAPKRVEENPSPEPK
jgi:paraquat-inducible protein B